MTAPDGLSYPEKIAVSQGSHVRLTAVLGTLIRKDHPIVQAMQEVNLDILEQET